MIEMAIHRLDEYGVGEKIGYLYLQDTAQGLLIEPRVERLTPGFHGFHVHEYANLEPMEKDGKMVPGLAAGNHYDPFHTGQHLGPYGHGHLGDLPKLKVNRYGFANEAVLAPRLKLQDIYGRSIIIHSGSDNYSDSPKPNGGGESRIAGGVVTNGCPYCR